MVDFQQGLTKAGLLDEALAALRWGASYLMACHPQPNVFMAVQGNHSLDFHYYVGTKLGAQACQGPACMSEGQQM